MLIIFGCYMLLLWCLGPIGPFELIYFLCLCLILKSISLFREKKRTWLLRSIYVLVGLKNIIPDLTNTKFSKFLSGHVQVTFGDQIFREKIFSFFKVVVNSCLAIINFRDLGE